MLTLFYQGVHGIVGVKLLSYGGKWMRNKGFLIFKQFEGEYSMIWFRISGQSMNEMLECVSDYSQGNHISTRFILDSRHE